jgi:hypothetical protein
MCKKFILERPPVYRLGKDFSEVLAGVENDIPMDRLPEKFFAYISFPKGTVTDDTGHIIGAYVFVGDAKETTAHPNLWGNKVLWMSIIGSSVYSDDYTTEHILMKCEDTFEETFNRLVIKDHFRDYPIGKELMDTPAAKRARLNACRSIVNSLLYIHSLEPNIDHLKPMTNLTHGQRRDLKDQGKNINLCTLPVIAVNWAYKRERVFGVDETWRSEHHRWQRCGPGNSQIKLTLVKGHKVKYKTTHQSTSAISVHDG